MKLLIVDDESLMRGGLETLDWRSAGILEFRSVGDGSAAMNEIKRGYPDIILSDINMPNLDGIQLAEYIFGHSVDCKIIFLSGYNDFKYAKSALTYGVFDYVLKPSDPEEILASVARAVSVLKSEREHVSTVASLRRDLFNREISQQIDEHCRSADAPPRSEELLRRVFQYINANYHNNISLVTLSQELHFSSIYICRILKKKTGHTFLEILTAVRMMRAAHLLANTEMKVSEVAAAVGIEDQKYFSQVFKKTFSIPPMEYRKKHTGQRELDLGELLNSGGPQP